MRAAIFNGVGSPLEIAERPTPLLREGDVLVRVAFCGICGSDLHAAADASMGLAAGAVMGHEFSGEIVESAAPNHPVGERICGIPLQECEDCRPLGACRRGLGMVCPGNKVIGLSNSADGAYAEFVRIGASRAVPLPDNVSLEHGALVEPLAVASHALARIGAVSGVDILIVGAGPIGLAVTMLARASGARSLVVSEPHPGRRGRALRLGATAAIDPSSQELRQAFRAATGASPSMVFECSGVSGMLQHCIDAAAIRASIVVVGVASRPEPIIPASALFKEITLSFALGYDGADFHHVIDLMRKGALDLDGYISRIVSFGELPKTFADMRHANPGAKVLIDPRR
ncbi:MAG: hypothetical protein BGP06_10365 [Rhizobiales bacterium 65-9]|nr:alcohol dehydrogenase catalytic domain-containing protein [Hyphomicrobiales bacterium]OJY32185.1 MAG: hypothetical protein BGP06_10365 [Rhizobiales bacterium 65-9]